MGKKKKKKALRKCTTNRGEKRETLNMCESEAAWLRGGRRTWTAGLYSMCRQAGAATTGNVCACEGTGALRAGNTHKLTTWKMIACCKIILFIFQEVGRNLDGGVLTNKRRITRDLVVVHSSCVMSAYGCWNTLHRAVSLHNWESSKVSRWKSYWQTKLGNQRKLSLASIHNREPKFIISR